MNSKMKCLPIYPYLSVRDRAEAVAARPSSTPPPLYRNTRGSVPLLSQYTPTLRMWWSMTISLLFITSLTDSPQQQPVAQTPLLYFTTHAHCQKKMVITHNRWLLQHHHIDEVVFAVAGRRRIRLVALLLLAWAEQISAGGGAEEDTTTTRATAAAEQQHNNTTTVHSRRKHVESC